jgi:hypothetical protein
MFKRILIAVLLAAPLCAFAAEEKAKIPQQQKTDSCNKQAAAKELKADARKKFMSECLSSGNKQAKLAQQEKKKICKKEASDKALKGDERKQFMSDCLKG